jgi:EAL domain-containing protein (putative c-di-GMP-specific phosphodiesterase class I)
VDDFGTGYSSLAYLKKLPVSELKIDQSFVFHMTDDKDDATIVRSTIDLGHNMGLVVVAEGIENKETWDMLQAMGCDLAQGYYISKPMDADALLKWFEQTPWKVVNEI